MNGTGLSEQQTAVQQVGDTLDSAVSWEQMRAVDHAMQQYFGAKDWLKERDKKFPGLWRSTIG